jgi:hypothetical protein
MKIRKLLVGMAVAASLGSTIGARDAVAQATPAAENIDPARLKLAEQVAGRLIPPGSYQKMMKEISDQMADGMIQQMMGMDAAIIAKSAGADAKDVAGKSLGEIASSADPHFKERMDITMKVMFDEMGKLMSAMEPTARAALAKVYARKYDARQLGDMNAFFATPSGSVFAGDFFATFSDREMMSSMMSEMPKLLEAMPAIMKKVEEATAHLPPAPKPEGTMDTAMVDTAVAAEDPYANETGDEPWHAEDGWTASEQKAITKLSDAYLKASEKSETAYTAYDDARLKAVNAARQRFLANGWTPPAEESVMAAEDIPANAVPPPAPPK